MSGQISPAQAADVAVPHDARAVHDAATLSWTKLTEGRQPRWVVARVNPAPQSGSTTIPGAVIRTDTGQLSVPAGAVPVMLRLGSWSPMAGSDPAITGGAYTWTEMLEEHKRTLVPEDFYSPFAKGGVIVFRPAVQASGRDQFVAAHLVFDEWASSVDGAGRYVVDHAALFEGKPIEPAEASQLTDLLSHANPLVRVSALRQLIASGRGTPELVQRSISSADHSAAVATYLAITAGDDRLVDAVRQFVSATKEGDKLRPIALGAYAASVFRGREEPIGARATAISRAIAERLGPLGQSNAYLDTLLRK